MSRSTFRLAVASAALAMIASGFPATAEPPDPFPLVRGLRQNGMADLAKEYLEENVRPLAAKDPAVMESFRLELAKTSLELADQTDSAVDRDVLLEVARVEFEKFLKGNPPPASAAEASVSMARIISLQAQALLNKAGNAGDAQAEKTQARQALPKFNEAAKKYEEAVAQLETVLKSDDLPPARRKELERELIQTKLDQATTKLRTADTFVNPGTKEIKARGDLIDEAKKQFKAIAKQYQKTPGEYVAKAWIGQCELLLQAKSDADKIFTDLARTQSPQVAAGLRLARFFEAKALYDAQDYAKASAAFGNWLRQYGGGRPTSETYAALYYQTLMRFAQIVEQLPKNPDDAEKIKYPLPSNFDAGLRQVERGFRRITRTDNDFTDRANKVRTKVIRYIVGDAEKKPESIKDSEEAVLTGLVRFQLALEGDPARREEAMTPVIALFEKALSLPPSADSDIDERDTKLKLVSAYLVGGQTDRAVELGKSLFESAGKRGAAVGAQAGFYAIQACLAAAGKLLPSEADKRAEYEGQAIAMAKAMNAKFPNDPSTDLARIVLGQLLSKNDQYMTDDPKNDPVGGAFQAYAAVNPGSAQGTQSRLLEGLTAFEILRPTSDQSDAVKNQVRTKAIDDLQAIEAPGDGATDDPVRLYVQTQLLLAQLHLMNYPDGLAEAEKKTQSIATYVDGLKSVTDDLKQTLAFQTEETRLRAVFGLAAPLFQNEKYEQVMARIGPEIEKMKPAVTDKQGDALRAAAQKLDEFRRERLLVLALQTRIRQGKVGEAQALFAKLENLGGSLEATINALTQLLGMIQPQLETLRKQGEDGKQQYDTLVAGVSKILDDIAGRPNLGPREWVFLGRSLRNIGSPDRAVTVLEKIPPPAKPELLNEKNPIAIQDETDRLSVVFYRGAQLELAKAYRMAGNFAEAEKVLKAAMGTDENPGWAKKAIDFRKEALYTIEDKAESISTPKDAQPVWEEAKSGWAQISGEYRAFLSQPYPSDPDKLAERKKIEPQIKSANFDSLYEYLRSLSRAKTSLMRDNPANLAKSMDGLAAYVKKMKDGNPDMDNESRVKFDGLLADYPKLNDAYVKAGGTPFVKPADEPPTP